MDEAPQPPNRGPALLLEHVAALDLRPTARERLERVVGGYLARLLVSALGNRHSARRAA